MSYLRVLPRDLFNEAKLLKCLGMLSLRIHDGNLEPMLKLRMDDPNEGFRIEQTIDGDTFVANLRLFINDHYIELLSPLNSREINPLYAAFESEIYQVFDDDGNFDSEFYKLWRDVGIKDE